MEKAHAHQPRTFIGPAALLESSHVQRSHSEAYRHTVNLQPETDQNLVRLLMATTLCGFGLLILALLR